MRPLSGGTTTTMWRRDVSRRLPLLLVAVSFLVALLTVGAGQASAATPQDKSVCTFYGENQNPSKVCQYYHYHQTVPGERVIDSRTETRQRTETRSCQVGNGSRQGEQEVRVTDEVLVETVETFETHHYSVQTEVYEYHGLFLYGYTEYGSEEEVTGTYERETVLSSTSEPVGKCRNVPGKQ